MSAYGVDLGTLDGELSAVDGMRFSGAVRDTVVVPPNTRVVVAFDANNPG